MHELHETKTNGENAVAIGEPKVAGGMPPAFRRSFVDSAVRDAEFLRLPPAGGRCPLTGLSRTSLIELADRGLINIKRVRKPGATRGIVLVQKASLLAYLYSLGADGEQHRAEPQHSAA
jgi:hypothetical protein